MADATAELEASERDWTHLLVETSSLDELKGPLRGSARLKYSCLDVSRKYLALGSNTGSVYVFSRTNLKHLQVVFPDVEPALVNIVSLCPNDKVVAFSTINGHVIVMELNIEKRQKPERLRLITDHLKCSVTGLQWDDVGSRLYVGDSTGRVTVSMIPNSKVKNLVVLPVEAIMKLESSVVQLDWCNDKLIVSTLNRSYLCNTARQNYSQIGTKPRDGEYGGCFLQQHRTSLPMIYCARPSSRMWEVDFEGNVLNTHQFKQLLVVPPLQVVNVRDESWNPPDKDYYSPQGINFPKLKTISGNYLLTWNKNRLYIFDPINVKVIVWCELITGIQDVCCHGNDAYVFFNAGDVLRLQLLSVNSLISFIISKSKYSLTANILSYFMVSILKTKWQKYLPLSKILDLPDQLLQKNQSDLAERIRAILPHFQNSCENLSDTDSSESCRSRSGSGTSVMSSESRLSQISSEKIQEKCDREILEYSRKGSFSSSGLSNGDINSVDTENNDNLALNDIVNKDTMEEISVQHQVVESVKVSVDGDAGLPQDLDSVKGTTVNSVDSVDKHQGIVPSDNYRYDDEKDEIEFESTSHDVNETVVENNESNCKIDQSESHSDFDAHVNTSVVCMESNSPKVDDTEDIEALSSKSQTVEDQRVQENSEENGNISSLHEESSFTIEKICDQKLNVTGSDESAMTDGKSEVQMNKKTVINNDTGKSRTNQSEGKVNKTIQTKNKVDIYSDDIFSDTVVNNIPGHEDSQPSNELTSDDIFSDTVVNNIPGHGDSQLSNELTSDDIFSDTVVNNIPGHDDSQPSNELTSDDIFATTQAQDQEPVIIKNTQSADKQTSQSKKKKKVNSVDIFSPGEEKPKKKKGKSPGVRRIMSTGSLKSSPKKGLNQQMSVDFPIDENVDVHMEPLTDRNDVVQSGDIFKSSSVPKYPKSPKKGVPKVQSDSDLKSEKTGSLANILDFDSRSTDGISFDAKGHSSSSLGSSPSQSPLSTSWESTISDTVTSRKSLSSVKDSIQSKFSNTKKLLLKTIKESQKNLLSKSPSREESGTIQTIQTVDQLFKHSSEQPETKYSGEVELEVRVPVCPVDISELVKVTEDTQKILQDISVLCNPAHLKSALSKWAVELNKTLQKLHTKQYQEKLKQKHKLTCPHKCGKIVVQSKNGMDDITTQSKTSASKVDCDVTIKGLTNQNDGIQISDEQHVGIDVTTDLDEENERNREDISCQAESVSDCTNREKQQVVLDSVHSESFDIFKASQNNVLIDISSKDFDIYNIANISDPFCLSTDLHSTMAALTQNCFVSGCYGDIGEYIKPNLTTVDLLDICDRCTVIGNASVNQVKASSHSMKIQVDGSSVCNCTSELICDKCKFLRDCQTSVLNNGESNHPQSSISESIENSSTSIIESVSETHDSTRAHMETSFDTASFTNDTHDNDHGINDESHKMKHIDQLHTHRSSTESRPVIENMVAEDQRHTCQSSVEAPPLSDQCLFVQAHFHLLDISKIREVLYTTQEDCLDLWSTLIRCQHELCTSDMLSVKLNNKEINSAVDILRTRTFSAQMIMGYISKLFVLSPSKATDICIDCQNVKPIDVLYMCKYYNKSDSQYFFKFMVARVSTALLDKRRHYKMDLYGHHHVLTRWLELLLSNQNLSQQVFDEQGNPSCWSHKIEWKHQDMIDHVIKTCTGVCHQEVLHICRSAGYWIGYLEILKIMNRYTEMTEIILELGDIQLLNNKLKHGFLPSSIDEWGQFMEIFSRFYKKNQVKLHDSTATDNGKENLASPTTASKGNAETESDSVGVEQTISWKDMSFLLLHNLGTVQTVNILQECNVPDNCLPPDFFQSAIFSAFINRQQMNITHNMLEKLDAYLWTKKSNCLMPQLQFAASKEKQSRNQQNRSENTVSFISTLSGTSTNSTRYSEDPECHWGVSTKLTRNCKCCNLPLTETISHVEPGILVFDCGHSFHKVCLPNRECLICQNDI